MIVCSCAQITDRDLERAVLEIMRAPNAPLPTPGVVYRHLQKKMQCCGCAPLAIEIIYAKMEQLQREGLICPCACTSAKDKLLAVAGKPAEEPSRVLSVTESNLQPSPAANDVAAIRTIRQGRI